MKKYNNVTEISWEFFFYCNWVKRILNSLFSYNAIGNYWNFNRIVLQGLCLNVAVFRRAVSQSFAIPTTIFHSKLTTPLVTDIGKCIRKFNEPFKMLHAIFLCCNYFLLENAIVFNERNDFPFNFYLIVGILKFGGFFGTDKISQNATVSLMIYNDKSNYTFW